ncbi:MAG: RidA family protein [Pseudomonadota bacterium]
MNRVISTDTAPPPFSDYAQAVETPPGSRLLHVSGQVGVRLDGTLPDDPVEQHENVWKNIFAILVASGMAAEDIVDVRCFVNSHEEVPRYREVRDRMLTGVTPCSTMVVAPLASPDWRVEVAVVAAKSG